MSRSELSSIQNGSSAGGSRSGRGSGVVRWSDDTECEALRWYGDEVLVSEGDLLGKMLDQLAPCTFGETATGFGHRGRSTARFRRRGDASSGHRGPPTAS
jgi:hypothetical protein